MSGASSFSSSSFHFISILLLSFFLVVSCLFFLSLFFLFFLQCKDVDDHRKLTTPPPCLSSSLCLSALFALSPLSPSHTHAHSPSRTDIRLFRSQLPRLLPSPHLHPSLPPSPIPNFLLHSPSRPQHHHPRRQILPDANTTSCCEWVEYGEELHDKLDGERCTGSGGRCRSGCTGSSGRCSRC